MTHSVYLAKDGRSSGPFSEEDLRDLIEKGLVMGDDLVWHEGLTGWTRVSDYFSPSFEGASEPAAVSYVQPLCPPHAELASFIRSVPGIISCALGAIALFATLQIAAQVWRYSDRSNDATQQARIAQPTSWAIQQAAANSPDYVALEYERVRQQFASDDRVRSQQDAQKFNDQVIWNMTPEQRADEVNRQTLYRMNGH